ncbi:stellacyanin-like [Diospyros lotus]|uniref:stellacyanin-like n=1 Tax=Diospyros lotus TaxID=55363 RepID=UPI0022514E40|nr:stellacyanin-like [Diospyros lotus]
MVLAEMPPSKHWQDLAFLQQQLMTALVESSTAATYTVGESSSWQCRFWQCQLLCQLGHETYLHGGRLSSFGISDLVILMVPSFQLFHGAHDVTTVTEADFNSCNSAHPIALQTTGPAATIKLNSTGMHYYICTIANHCSLGQKLSINVTSASTPSGSQPPPAAGCPTSPPTTTAPPLPSISAPAPVGMVPPPFSSSCPLP